MLDAPQAHRFTENFAGQWLDLRKIDATIPDPQLYGDFDDLLLWAMPRETELFFEEVLRNDLSLLEFVDSDWTMLNERLAPHYGIPGVSGSDLRKVTLPPGSHRGGVMTQASVLKVTADGTRTSPVLRGKWVLERILGKPPAPPPPDVPAIEPDIRGATTIRQQLDKHRNTAGVRRVPRPHRSARLRPGELRPDRRLARVLPRHHADQGRRRPHCLIPAAVPSIAAPTSSKAGRRPRARRSKTSTSTRRLLLEDKDQLARNLTREAADLRDRRRHPVRRPRSRRADRREAAPRRTTASARWFMKSCRAGCFLNK